MLPKDNKPYIGRFAPSPTGSLHFGSLIAATASYLCAKSKEGKWLLRIEDVDQFRVKKDSIYQILQTLEQYGYQWDDAILYQSQRTQAYDAALNDLGSLVYPCSCTRKFLRKQMPEGTYGYVYPSFCREKMTNPDAAQFAIRLRTHDEPIGFTDYLQGDYQQAVALEVGDFILKRSDQLFSYQLAVVVDDEYQQITEVVRGSDLLDNTPRQCYLQHCLNYQQPQYLHFPTAVTPDGKKLSKQNHSPEVSDTEKRQTILDTLHFLGQAPPALDQFSCLNDVWVWAIQYWDRDKIPAQMTLPEHYPNCL
ncbi:MAG: tRNA glutamyl-Q(34) synthetase GluQRS [Cocleimonas sp.]|nr:tRNA glutamyl-Q(34) synthetase GluQRS [Cocleimonas sp.]